MSKMILIDPSEKFIEFFDKKDEARKIDFLVLHHIEANSFEHAISQLKEHKVSSHFLVDELGKIFELVDENDVAYHAGVSFWRGYEGLNKNSIGIEFINAAPFSKRFEVAQMQAGVELCRYLMEKYNIAPRDVIGHSDIAYSKETNVLDRKQDPSHLFDWKFFAQNGVGIFPEIVSDNKMMFELGNKGAGILGVKKKLKEFGYRLLNLNEEFDEELQAVARVFNRHFLGKDLDVWCGGSQSLINKLI